MALTKKQLDEQDKEYLDAYKELDAEDAKPDERKDDAQLAFTTISVAPTVATRPSANGSLVKSNPGDKWDQDQDRFFERNGDDPIGKVIRMLRQPTYDEYVARQKMNQLKASGGKR